MKLDAIGYIIDFLPNVVQINFEGKNIGFELKIHLSGTRGILFTYQFSDVYSDSDIDLESIQGYLNKEFNSHGNYLYHAEYIRSEPELKAVAQSCYRFLWTNNLIRARQQAIRKKVKIFPTITNG